jgi:hypothetical protein
MRRKYNGSSQFLPYVFALGNGTSEAVEELEEGPQTETTTSEINRLKQLRVNQKIKIRVTGLKAEKVADDRDAILAKDCRKFI